MTTEDSILTGPLQESDKRLSLVAPLIDALLPKIAKEEGDETQRTYEKILAKLHSCVHVQSISLVLHDGFRERLSLVAATGMEKSELPDEQYRSFESLTGMTLLSANLMFSNDMTNDPRATRKWVEWWSDKCHPNSFKHGVWVPIAGELELHCVLRFFNRLLPNGSLSSTGFSVSDRQVLEILARLTAVQLNNVWLSDRLNILGASIDFLATQTTVTDVAGQVANTGARLANAAAGAVFLPDEIKPDFLRLRGSYGFRQAEEALSVPIDRSLMGRVFTTGVPLAIEDLQAESNAFPDGPGKSEGMASLAAFPLGSAYKHERSQRETKPMRPGVLLVYSKMTRKFGTSTCNLLQQFALSGGEIIDNRSRAQESNRLRQILSLAAHSVRSPLGRVSIALAKLRKKDTGNLTAEIRAAFTNLRLANARLETMLYSQKGLIEITGLSVSQIGVGQIIERCVDRHKAIAAARGIQIELRDNVRKLPRIPGDADKLDLVFDNLIENAEKYSWKNETVVISSEITGNSVRISVTDKGLGIPESMREKIFDTFIRSEVLDRTRHIKGTGLGLYVSKLIVEAHGGAIRVKSSPFLDDPERRLAYEGYETTFTVTLPRERAA